MLPADDAAERPALPPRDVIADGLLLCGVKYHRISLPERAAPAPPPPISPIVIACLVDGRVVLITAEPTTLPYWLSAPATDSPQTSAHMSTADTETQ